jgi:transglutaminase-like putative cysteine protease
MKAKDAPVPLPRVTQRWVLAALLGAVLLNGLHIAAWCLPLAAGAAAWRSWAAQRPDRLPTRKLRIAVAGLLTLAVLASFRTLNGLDAGTSLLVAMMALKLMETQRARDWLIVIGGGLFLLLAACLASQALWLLPCYAAELWLLCIALYAVGASSRPVPAPLLLRAAARNLAIALPLAALLFLFFPRLSGSLWSVPREDEATTGLADRMSPGSIAELVDSDDPALRVRFSGPLPPRDQRYWRGPILHQFDGATWSRTHRLVGEPPALRFAPRTYDYDVTLEPNTPGVLIALDLPREAPEGPLNALRTVDDELLAGEPLSGAVTYHLVSSPVARSSESLPLELRQLDLQLPNGRNPRTLELARALRKRAPDEESYVRSALDYLRDNGFEYTRTPARLGRNSVDELLFNTREGFCGHYASAFAVLMRAGGLPAHVVTGYLGGSWNRYGQYLLVKQSNAHAWVEVWIDGAGWQRVDPTAVIDTSQYQNEFDDASIGVASAGGQSRLARFFLASGQMWQAVNAWWQDQFVHFNVDRQFKLLSLLGFKERGYQTLVALVALAFAVWLSFLAWRGRGLADGKAQDALGRIWRRLERSLRRRFGERAPHEGPVAYGERLAALRPELGATLRLLTREYARLRYGRECSGAALRHFDRAVRLFTARSRPYRQAG